MRPILYAIFLVSSLVQCVSLNQNDDNTIYNVGDISFYSVTFLDSLGLVEKIDTLRMEVTNGFYPERKQTRIEYYYRQHNYKEVIEYNSWTGVIDSKDYFFIHPPRVGDLYVLSFSEFPRINNTFLDSLHQYSYEGEMIMSKHFNGQLIKKVNTSQKYLGKTAIELKNYGRIRVHRTYSIAKSNLGIIVGDYFFSEKLGFVQLDYTLPRGKKILIERI